MQDALGLRRLPEQQFKWEVPVNRRPQPSRKEPVGGKWRRPALGSVGSRRAGWNSAGAGGGPSGSPEQRCWPRGRGETPVTTGASPQMPSVRDGAGSQEEAPLQRRRGLWEGLQGPGIGQASEMWEQNDCRARAPLPSCAQGGGADHTNVWCHSCLH